MRMKIRKNYWIAEKRVRRIRYCIDPDRKFGELSMWAIRDCAIDPFLNGDIFELIAETGIEIRKGRWRSSCFYFSFDCIIKQSLSISSLSRSTSNKFLRSSISFVSETLIKGGNMMMLLLFKFEKTCYCCRAFNQLCNNTASWFIWSQLLED